LFIAPLVGSLEPGFNRGGNVDTFQRYIYIHGFNDESDFSRPIPPAAIHMAGSDLIPLLRSLPIGTLVWIGESLSNATSPDPFMVSLFGHDLDRAITQLARQQRRAFPSNWLAYSSG